MSVLENKERLWFFLGVERAHHKLAAPLNTQAGPRRATYAGDHAIFPALCAMRDVGDGRGGAGVHGASVYVSRNSWSFLGAERTRELLPRPPTRKQDHDATLTRVHTPAPPVFSRWERGGRGRGRGVHGVSRLG